MPNPNDSPLAKKKAKRKHIRNYDDTTAPHSPNPRRKPPKKIQNEDDKEALPKGMNKNTKKLLKKTEY